MDIIKIKNLVKKFDKITAVNSISFTIKEGEIFGFLGPNGAGKTTTLSMLATILEPTSGEASVNNFNIATQKNDVRKSIGMVFQDSSLDDELTAYENMDFHGRIYDVPREKRKEKIIELLKLVELDSRKNDLVKTFSGGMRRRLEIARGLLHEPKVLFLDEPTMGLDPQTRNKIWKYVNNLNKEKKITIILTTHYMDEADKLCERVAIIDKGKIIKLDIPDNLKDSIGDDVISVFTESKNILDLLKKFPWFKSGKIHNGCITINLQNAEKHVTEIVKIASENKIEIKSLEIHKPTLEDVFLHFTGKTIREEEADPNEAMKIRHRMMRR